MRSLHLTAALLLATAVSAQSLTTTFTTNNNVPTTAVLPSVSFDLNVTNPAGVLLNGLVLNCSYLGIAGTAELYFTSVGGTAAGNTVNPAPGTWRLRATGPFVTAGAGTGMPVTLNKPVYLAPGAYGVVLVYKYASARYVGTTTAPPAQITYANSDLSITGIGTQTTTWVSAPVTPRLPSLTLNYTIPTADTVDFTADIPKGPSPLAVNFTSAAFLAGTVVGYEWDFDNNGTVDATTQNATHTYPACGTYSVKHRILTSNGPVEYVWNNMVTVDPLEPTFIASVTSGAAPLTVQFTDTTNPPATSWAWDFDGDGVTDDTTQNPAWTYVSGSFNTRLTASNGCRTASATQRIDAVASTFSTNFTAATNATQLQGMCFLDLVVTSQEALVLTALDTNTILNRNNPMDIKVWVCDGSAQPNWTNPSAWRLGANGSGLSAGGNQPSRMVLDRPVLLLPGRTYGLAIHHLNSQTYYNNPGNTSLTTLDFTVNFQGIASAVAGPFTATPLNPRQWNGTLYYAKEGLERVGSSGFYGLGCAGSLGVPALEPTGGRPRLGNGYGVNVTNMPLAAGFSILGFSSTSSLFGPLPLDLTFFGMPGCFARASTDSTNFLAGFGNSVTWTLPLPANPGLAGLKVYQQALVLDPTANTFGGVMSDASAILLGF
ncbi:MAG: hypothetical protein RL148_324 [Planctomycetota bacterium]|jgi:PKD repeat protein